MGMTFIHNAQQKSDIINICIAPMHRINGTRQCIKKSVTNNELWTIWLDTETNTKSIVLFILAKESNPSCWGYKELSESESPYYFKCPLYFLAEVPVACEEWRQKVREYHNHINQGRRIKAAEKRDAKNSSAEL